MLDDRQLRIFEGPVKPVRVIDLEEDAVEPALAEHFFLHRE